MLTYNKEQLHTLLNHISNLVKTCVSLYHENFEPSQAFSTETEGNVCSMIKSNFIGRCYRQDLQVFDTLKNQNVNSVYYTCHFGFTEVALKIKDGNSIFGYVIVGPFRSPEHEKQVLKNINDCCDRYDLNKDELMNAYYDMPEFSEKLYNSLKGLLFPLFDYSISKNLLTLKNSIFSSDIEPYIANHLADDLSVDFLCKKFYMSPKKLCKFFSENTQMLPKEYITIQRIIQAKQLLIQTDDTLPDIAQKVGFGDYNYFIKVFKKHTHHTPSYYRKTKK